MSLSRTVPLVSLVCILTVTVLHASLNWHVQLWRTDKAVPAVNRFRIGYLPVTCHLTCPVTDFINRSMTGEGIFEPVRFSGWPELKEAYLSNYTSATFILAPMAMALREQGVPLKIVYLGHRDGTALVVHKDSAIRRIEDLVGKTVAFPSRFSNQRLLLYKAFKDHNLDIKDLKMVEMPPPDMPAALYAHAVDGITSGEPFMAQAELEGYGRVLYLTRDVWPNFISCVLAVSDDVLRTRRPEVQELVNGIARSGKWLDQKMDHRMDASQFVNKVYYHQDPRLLAFVLSKPPDRVTYSELSPLRHDFDEIYALGVKSGILQGTIRFEDYVDPTLAGEAAGLPAYQWEAPKP